MAQVNGNPYFSQTVESASNTKLVELLYEGCIRFCQRALDSIERRDPEAAHNNILRAYAIVAELQATLDLEAGGEIAANLERCYDFLLDQLKQADVSKQPQPLHNCLRVVEPLLSGWQQAHGAQSQPETVPAAVPATGRNGHQGPAKRAHQAAALDITG